MSCRVRHGLSIVLLALVSCTQAGATQPVVTARSDRVDPSLEEFADPTELELAITSFGKCVEQRFPIVIRFRVDPFIGMSTEVGSQRQEEGDLVDQVVAQCSGQLDLDRRLGDFQSRHPVTPSDQRRLVDDFISCATTVSTQVGEELDRADPDSIASIGEFVAGVSPMSGDVTADEAIAVSDCQAEVTGAEHVFADGHPWFVP